MRGCLWRGVRFGRGSRATVPLFTTEERDKTMKLKMDWNALLRAVIKAAWPFVAGAVGGLISGCTVGGIGPNFFGG